jgi:hypothetical protein
MGSTPWQLDAIVSRDDTVVVPSNNDCSTEHPVCVPFFLCFVQFLSFGDFKLISLAFGFRLKGKLGYWHFRVGSRHIEFTTSGIVGCISHWFQCIGGPRICKFSLWNFVSISSGSWDIGISGFEAAMFNLFTTSGIVGCFSHWSHCIGGPGMC